MKVRMTILALIAAALIPGAAKAQFMNSSYSLSGIEKIISVSAGGELLAGTWGISTTNGYHLVDGSLDKGLNTVLKGRFGAVLADNGSIEWDIAAGLEYCKRNMAFQITGTSTPSSIAAIVPFEFQFSNITLSIDNYVGYLFDEKTLGGLMCNIVSDSYTVSNFRDNGVEGSTGASFGDSRFCLELGLFARRMLTEHFFVSAEAGYQITLSESKYGYGVSPWSIPYLEFDDNHLNPIRAMVTIGWKWM